MLHKGQDGKRVRPVDPIPRGRSSGRRQDAIGLVEPQGFAADTAARGDLADEQAVASHASSLNPPPWGQVKRLNVVVIPIVLRPQVAGISLKLRDAVQSSWDSDFWHLPYCYREA